MSNQPKVSIITVTYNAARFIERCILNIASQTYPNIEHIIIDGNSTDGTQLFVNKYNKQVSIFVSENDNGLYDAMNKGIRLATGKYLWFINADDQIFEADTLSNIFKHNKPGCDVYFGETLIVDAQGNEIGMRRHSTPEILTANSLKKGMKVSHQSILVKKSLSFEYDIKYRFSADYDWVVKVLKQAKSVCNTHQILSKFNDQGLTKQNMKAGLKERFWIMTKHFGLFSTLFQHIIITFRFVAYFIKNRRI